MEKIEIQAVEMVRRIRDQQAALLASKSEAEVDPGESHDRP